jgi:hypothetical protein
MKRTTLLWVIMITMFFTLPRIASAQADRRDDIREEWQERLDEWMRGDRRDSGDRYTRDRDRRDRDTRDRDRRDRDIRDRDRRDRDIRDRDVRELEGRWYANGERDKPAEIVSSRGELQARDERGRTSRLEVDRDGDIRALDWERGLRGEVRRDRIEWANGRTWTRNPSERVARRR